MRDLYTLIRVELGDSHRMNPALMNLRGQLRELLDAHDITLHTHTFKEILCCTRDLTRALSFVLALTHEMPSCAICLHAGELAPYLDPLTDITLRHGICIPELHELSGQPGHITCSAYMMTLLNEDQLRALDACVSPRQPVPQEVTLSPLPDGASFTHAITLCQHAINEAHHHQNTDPLDELAKAQPHIHRLLAQALSHAPHHAAQLIILHGELTADFIFHERFKAVALTLLDTPERLDHMDRLKLQRTLVHILMNQSARSEALDIHTTLMHELEGEPMTRFKMACIVRELRVLIDRRDFTLAQNLYDKMHELALEHDWTEHVIGLRFAMNRMRTVQQDTHQRAHRRTRVDDMLDILSLAHTTQHTGWMMRCMASLSEAVSYDHPEQARDYNAAALASAQQLHAHKYTLMLRTSQLNLAHRTNQIIQSKPLLESLLADTRAHRYPFMHHHLYTHLILVHLHAQMYPLAIARCRGLMDYARDNNIVFLMSYSWIVEVFARFLSGQHEQACALRDAPPDQVSLSPKYESLLHCIEHLSRIRYAPPDTNHEQLATQLIATFHRLDDENPHWSWMHVLWRHALAICPDYFHDQRPLLTLLTSHDMSFFYAPGHTRAALVHRPYLHNMFRALVQAYQRNHARQTTYDLFQAGWPGESIKTTSMANRVYVGIAHLRQLGLGSWLHNSEQGYAISEQLDIVLCDAPSRLASDRAAPDS